MSIKLKIATSMVVMSLMTTLYANDTRKLDELTVVSASGYEQDILKAPATISVITAKDIEGKGYVDVAAALKDVPGVFVSGGGSTGKGMGGETISIRGMNSSDTLYLINGKPISDSGQTIYNGEGTGYEMGLLPPMSSIERIEVIKGPMSSLYGSQALGGVINIITKKVLDTWSGSVGIQQTIQDNSDFGNTQAYNFYAAGPVVKDKLNLTLTGQFTKQDEDKVYSGSKEQDRKNFGSKFDWLINEANTLSFTYAYSKQESSGDGGTYILKDGSPTTQDPSDNEIENNVYDITHTLNWGSDFETISYVKYEDTDNDTGGQDGTGGYQSSFETTIFNTKTVMPFDTNVLTLGFEYIQEEADHGNRALGNNNSTTVIDKYNYSVFAEDEYFITDSLSLTGGLRVNKDEYFGSEAIPRVYAVYTVNDSLTLKGGITAGYKSPDIDQATDGFVEGYGGGRGYIEGNSDLEPETSTSYEIGINYAVNDNINLDATVYKTDYKDKIETLELCNDLGGSCTPAGLPTKDKYSTYINVDEVEIHGMELSITYALDTVTLNAKYTYNESEVMKDSSGGGIEGNPLNNTPKHMYNLGASWDVTPELYLWSKLKYVGSSQSLGRSGTISNELPAYTIVDLGTKYDFSDNLSVNFNINNALDKEIEYEEYEKVLDGRNYTVGMVYNF